MEREQSAMAKKSIIESKILGLSLDLMNDPRVSEADIERLVADLNLSSNVDVTSQLVRALHRRLEGIADSYFGYDEPSSVRPTPSQLADRFERIHKAAGRLLKSLYQDDSGDYKDLPDALRYGYLERFADEDAKELKHAGTEIPLKFGSQLLRQSVESVHLLRGWASESRKLAKSEADSKSAKANQGDAALNGLIATLTNDVWVGLLEKKKSVNYDAYAEPGEESSNPTTDFVKRVLDLFGIKGPGGQPLTHAAIRERIRRASKESCGE